MKYELQGHFICNTPAIRTAIATFAPDTSDVKLWKGPRNEFSGATEYEADDGNMVIDFRVIYNNKTDRETLLGDIKGLADLMSKCEKGSYLKPIGCNHDTDPTTPCIEQAGGLSK